MDGILNINKPLGMTSFGSVARIRRLLGEKRVGHAGTLDPMATGVLPVCFGQGTRVIEFLAGTAKIYRAGICLGIATDTYDATGRITAQKDPSGISREQFEQALGPFRGLIEQIPPLFSAVKHHGKPLYQLARAGISIEIKSRPVQIHRLELIEWKPPQVTIEIECGKGTYVRSIAHDLGMSLGCGASLTDLVRLEYGPFSLESSITLSQLEEAFNQGNWQKFVYPIDTVFSQWIPVSVNDDTARAVINGRPVCISGVAPSEARCRVYNIAGRFLGILQYNSENGYWQPGKNFVSN